MHTRTRLITPVLSALVLGLMLALGTGSASAARSDLYKVLENCASGSSHGMSTRPSSVCVAVYGDAQAFADTPGTLNSPSIREKGAAATSGYQRAQGVVNPNFIWSDWFSNTTNLSGYVDGTWTVGPVWGGPIGQQTVALRVTGDPDNGEYVSCANALYLVCTVARSGGDLKLKNRYTYSLVRISTRPLMIRIANQSGHTLTRTSPSILTTNLLRDDRIGDPISIPSYDPANPEANVGWYNFYRAAVRSRRANSFEATYRLDAGVLSNLRGATVRVIIARKADGTDDNSRCIADTRFATYLQCTVDVAGSASGNLIATVYVGQ